MTWVARTGRYPFIDCHRVVIAADADRVWLVLVDSLPGRRHNTVVEALAEHVLGCETAHPDDGTAIQVGSSTIGFRVDELEPKSLLALAGRHRFSRYRLVFELQELDRGRTQLLACTEAEFPGVTGRLYRAAVIDSRLHRLSVRRILRQIQTVAERSD